jgi:uncharacterized protein YjiS (DUF1127 family)
LGQQVNIPQRSGSDGLQALSTLGQIASLSGVGDQQAPKDPFGPQGEMTKEGLKPTGPIDETPMSRKMETSNIAEQARKNPENAALAIMQANQAVNELQQEDPQLLADLGIKEALFETAFRFARDFKNQQRQGLV